MEFSKLRLNPGSQLSLEIIGSEGQKHQVKLIGYISTRTLLVTTPMLANDRPLLVRKDQEVVIRFFANRTAGAFKTKVRHICTTPYHYLHLTYPGNVETGEVRKAERVLANVPVSAINESQKHSDNCAGAIVDISTSGAKLETRLAIAAVGDTLKLTAKLQVGRVTRVVSWKAKVKVAIDRFDLEDTEAAYGLEFGYLSDTDYLALQAYVSTQLVKGLQA